MKAESDAWAVAATVQDPELPFVTIEELGILRGVERDEEGSVTVTVTPTYSGCPATEVIRDTIVDALTEAGFEKVRVETQLSPAWSTDDLTAEGRRKLSQAGIAPPRDLSRVASEPILCPRCRGESTRVVAAFGSTACKALMVCEKCGEPFDHFKEI
ncbi:MAG: 1,2-phenylacetyl-CoA epoxidase subunit PaaD [Acidimicrobiia bacterium]